MKKQYVKTLCAIIVTGGVFLFGTVPVFAYEDGKVDTNTTSQEVKKTDSAIISAKGTFKEFDPTQPTDPTDPTPDPTDKAWVDVKIPTEVFFGQTDVSMGIISPKYEIQNLSTKGVKVSVSDFKDSESPSSLGVCTDADKIKNQLTLNFTNLTENKVVELHTPDEKKPAQFPAEIAVLHAQNDKMEFKLSGNIEKGFSFEKEVLKPQYNMVLKFEVI